VFGWLKSIYNGAIGKLSDVERWIVGAINAVYSFFNGLIQQVWIAIQAVGYAIQWYVRILSETLNSLNTLAEYILTKVIPSVVSWATNELAKLRNFAVGVYNWAVSQIRLLGTVLLAEIQKVVQWVLRNVWDPLYNLIKGILHWITNEGAYVYYLLTHPDKLAALLGKYILGSWIALGQRYAKPFVKWLVHNMLSQASWLGGLLEDIIVSIL
jgi:hypothetical protein